MSTLALVPRSSSGDDDFSSKSAVRSAPGGSHSSFRVPTIVGGKYLVAHVIGVGGMGVVLAATHIELGHQVALKFIKPSAGRGREVIERFICEARSIARLRSEHVARVFDVGCEGHDNPYMVLELLEGEDLGRLQQRHGRLPVSDVVEYVMQACMGLAAAHAAGILHRDLKPQNLFITRRQSGAPLVKLLDFGIAKDVERVGQFALTHAAAVIGSPFYMAPEQMRSARFGELRSDIWSIGVMLYQLLGGRLPFDGPNIVELCMRAISEPPMSLFALQPTLDPRLVAVVMRCLEKDPERRWQNVGQLIAALEPYASSTDHCLTVRRIPAAYAEVPAPSARGSFGLGMLTGVVLALGATAAVVLAMPRFKPAHAPAAIEAPASAPPPLPVATPLESAPRPLEAIPVASLSAAAPEPPPKRHHAP